MDQKTFKMTYALFHCHSMYSYLDGYGSPEKNAKRAKDVGIHTLAITDHGSVCGHVVHLEACKKAGIKAALGIELYLPYKPSIIKDKTNRSLYHQVIWAKNHQGWKTMSKIVSYSNEDSNFYYRPRISLFNSENCPGLESFLDGNVMSFSGHQGSLLSNALFCDPFDGDLGVQLVKLNVAYSQNNKDPEFYKRFLVDGWLDKVSNLAIRMEKMFGKGNFAIELQNECNPNDKKPLWVHPFIVDCLRQVSKNTGIPACVSSDPHYPSPEDAVNQRAMVMINMKETEGSVQAKLLSETENDIMAFFGSDNFYIHTPEEMAQKFTEEEMANSIKMAEQIEQYSLNHKPYIPAFKVPEFDKNAPFVKDLKTDEDKYLMHLIIEGARAIKPWLSEGAIKGKITKDDYWKRVLMETGVIFEAGLSPYFLIVHDFVNAGRNRPKDHSFDWQKNLAEKGELDPCVIGDGRGSACGCLISYLIGITGVDSLVYKLSFGRFYNKGRNTKDKVEFPDIDMDFSVKDREWIIGYIEHKYGKENVGQIVTFQKMQGKAAVKDIFRIKGVSDGFEKANNLCKFIPNESEIMDEINDAKEEGEADYNILKWCLDNSSQVRELYDEDKDIRSVVDQAMTMEGIIRSQGRHPSALVITPVKIEDCFPMVLDSKTKKKIASYDMKSIEKCGAIKFDILGVAVLDKLKKCQNLVNK